MKSWIVFAICLLFAFPVLAADYDVETNETGTESKFDAVGPGDRLMIQPTGAGTRRYLNFEELAGTEANPITIINDGGQVVIDGDTVDDDADGDDHDAFGIYLEDCQWVNIDGSGGGVSEYGFKIQNVSNAGVNANQKSSHNIIKYVEVTGEDADPDAGISSTRIGITSKTETYDGVDVEREDWIQFGPVIEYCYLHDLAGEAIYIGESHWNTYNFPNHVQVYVRYNIIVNIGYDGIQVGSCPPPSGLSVPTGFGLPIAEDYGAYIYGNILYRIGISNYGLGPNTQCGIIINTGTLADTYDNAVLLANRMGIGFQQDDNLVRDNYLLYCGHGDLMEPDFTSEQKGAIHRVGDEGDIISGNTIVNPGIYGIYYNKNDGTIINNKIWNYGAAEPIETSTYNPTTSGNETDDSKLLPDGLAPANSATGIPLAGPLTWSLGLAQKVDVYCDKVDGRTTKIVDNGAVESDIPSLDPNDHYYWSVDKRYENLDGTEIYVEEGDVHTFETVPDPGQGGETSTPGGTGTYHASGIRIRHP